MKNILAVLMLTATIASAQLVSIPLLNGPIVYSNSLAAQTILPSSVGFVAIGAITNSLYYTNNFGQIVVPNGTTNLVDTTWTASGKTWPTALPATDAWSQTPSVNPVFSVVVSRAGTSNQIAFTLSRSYNGVDFTPLGTSTSYNTNHTITILQGFSATAVNSNYAITLPDNFLDGVRAVRIESIALGAGSNGIVRIMDARINGNRQ